jgi:hypothetical protein
MEQSTRVNLARSWTLPVASTLHEALFLTLSYADIFDYPLTLTELHRYLVGFAATRDVVASALNQVPEFVETEGYFTLPGRASLVPLRKEREKAAGDLWPLALKYGRWIARLPFVRMVGLTGALPMHNVQPGDDIDYLVVTVPGRVWVTRLMVIQSVVKLAARRGYDVCPNFLLAEHVLAIEEHDLFHAHELAHMVPVYGMRVYAAFRAANTWTETFLPNASGPPRVELVLDERRQVCRALVEASLQNRLGTWIEHREIARMQQKLSLLSGQQGGDLTQELVLSADRCKGHIRPHAHITQTAYAARLDGH